MASIEKHISDLLCLHDCVIVPGLGGFVANYKSAVIVEERNLLQPPKKEIGFNRSLSHNDGLLANHIGNREQKTWKESIALINDFVNTLNDHINRGETVHLGGVGSFRKDALGNFQFTPNERNELRPDAFGLDEFHFEPLQHITLTQKQEEPVRRLLRSRSPRYWTSVAAMIAGLLLFSPELKMPDHQHMDTSSMFSAISIDNESMSVPAKSDIDGKNEEAEVSGKDVSEENSTSVQVEIETPYHLIAASFKYEAPAKKTLEQFRKDGFPDAKMIQSESGRYRIALFSFSQRDLAVEKLYALRDSDQYKNVWLLTD